MLKRTEKMNNSLSEQLLEQCRIVFKKISPDMHPISLNKLPQLLHQLKIQIPETMLKDYTRWLAVKPMPKVTFKMFSHMLARSILQEDIQEEMRSLFYNIDKGKNGCLDAEDLHQFIKELDGGSMWTEQDIDELISEMDEMKVGYVTYEDLVYAILPR